jgi:SAM-dependent methyltransferase
MTTASPVVQQLVADRLELSAEDSMLEIGFGSGPPLSRLPWRDEQFTHVCAVNSDPAWREPLRDLGEVRRVLAEDGHLLLALRMRDPGVQAPDAAGLREHDVQRVRALLRQAGFRDVKSERYDVGQRVTCVLARR